MQPIRYTRKLLRKVDQELTALAGLAIDTAWELRGVAHCSLEANLAAVDKATKASSVEGESELPINEVNQGAAHLITASVHNGNAVIPAHDESVKADQCAFSHPWHHTVENGNERER